MTQEEKAKRYDKALEIARKIKNGEPINVPDGTLIPVAIFPELKESEDERIRKELLAWLKSIDGQTLPIDRYNAAIAWLEKQGSEPNWCHHKVDLSNYSEEYRKAYYDGWNNCNMQHSQCKSESNDVVKCLINGMKFYYEDNKEATWGTEKFSMKIKDILSWLEKQGGHSNFLDKIQIGDKVTRNEDGMLVNLSQLKRVAKPADVRTIGYWHVEDVEQKPAWSEEDSPYYDDICEILINLLHSETADVNKGAVQKDLDWLVSLRPQSQWKPSDEQIEALEHFIVYHNGSTNYAKDLEELRLQLKKLKE